MRGGSCSGGGGLPGPRNRGVTPTQSSTAHATIDSQVVRMRLPWSSRPDRRSWPIVALLAAACEGQSTDPGPPWDQWGQNGPHDGALAVTGQAPRTIDLDYVYDPFVTTEVADGAGSLPEHYMTPLTAGGAATMEKESGTHSPGTDAAPTAGR